MQGSQASSGWRSESQPRVRVAWPGLTVEVLAFDGPGPDRWTAAQASALCARLGELAARPGLERIVLTGPRLFLAARSPQAQAAGAGLEPILLQIAESPVPVVAAVPGHAANAGLELALACAARVGARGGTFALAGVHAARLPQLQTLRSLPKRVGVEAAGALVALGRPLDAERARRLGLVDALADGDVVEAASALALPQPNGSQAPVDGQAQVFLVRRMLKREAPRQDAPLAAVRAMEAAAQAPSHRAAAEVARIAADLARSPQGLALRYADVGSRRMEQREADDAQLAARLYWPLAREAIHLLDEGATPAQVDRVLTEYGFSRAPFATADALGLEAVFSADGTTLACGEDWACYSPTLDLMADGGRVGGRAPGWFRAVEVQASSRFDPEVEQLIHRSAVSQRLHRKPLGDQAVLERCLNAAVDAAYAMAEHCDGLGVEDMDAVWTSRLGFPAWRGGPAYDAALRGLSEVVGALTAAARRNTSGAPCAPLVAAAAAEQAAIRSRQDSAAS